MKNMLESVAVGLVLLLSAMIIYLIVQYNMIDDSDGIDELAYQVAEVKPVSKKEKTSNYLQNLEGYDDVDVKVDPTQENTANRVEVRSELAEDALSEAVEDKNKESYLENLNNYSTDEKKEKLQQEEPTAPKEHEPEKLEHDEIVDEIGLAIGAALEDL